MYICVYANTCTFNYCMRLSAMRSAELFFNTVSNPCFRSLHVLTLQQNDPSETTPMGIRSRNNFVCLPTVTKKQIEQYTDATDTNQLHSMVCSWGRSFFELFFRPSSCWDRLGVTGGSLRERWRELQHLRLLRNGLHRTSGRGDLRLRRRGVPQLGPGMIRC